MTCAERSHSSRSSPAPASPRPADCEAGTELRQTPFPHTAIDSIGWLADSIESITRSVGYWGAAAASAAELRNGFVPRGPLAEGELLQGGGDPGVAFECAARVAGPASDPSSRRHSPERWSSSRPVRGRRMLVDRQGVPLPRGLRRGERASLPVSLARVAAYLSRNRPCPRRMQLSAAWACTRHDETVCTPYARWSCRARSRRSLVVSD